MAAWYRNRGSISTDRLSAMPETQAAIRVWALRVPLPHGIERIAERLETQGWDGMLLTDSQNLAADVYVALTLAAKATSHLGLGTGVTNPVTRHPAATATAIHTVQEVSAGRAVLGIGRGDSSLFQLGREPVPVREFATYLEQLQGFLAGEDVDLDGHASRVRWIARSEQPKVPVDVAATGPKMIATAARLADRITFALGADPERLRWGIAKAREARGAAGLDPDDLSFGAYVNAAPHPDRGAARDLVRGGVSVFAHFSGMAGSSSEGVRAEDRRVFEGLHADYDRANHTLARARHAQRLDDDFLDRFAAIGTAAECRERFEEMVAAGVTRFVVTSASLDADRDAAQLSNRMFQGEVLPAIRDMHA